MSMKMWSGMGVVAMLGGIASCSGETGGGTSSTQGTSSSTTASTGTGGSMSGTGGTGGSMSGTGGTGGSMSGTSGTGGSMGYTSCGQCADEGTGAPMNECKTAREACFAIKECVGIYTCVFNGSPPCTNDEAGGCCTLDCYTATMAPQSAIDLYEAMDGCVYCTVCKDLCMTTDYCAVFEPGGDMVCNP
jgi:hypothetical protein